MEERRGKEVGYREISKEEEKGGGGGGRTNGQIDGWTDGEEEEEEEDHDDDSLDRTAPTLPGTISKICPLFGFVREETVFLFD